MVNGKWKGKTRNDKCSTYLQDKSTTLKLIPMLNPKQLLFSSNLLLKLKQYNKITSFLWHFFFLFHFFFSFFFLEELYSFFLFLKFFFSLNKYNKIKYTPTLAFWYTTIQIRNIKNIRSHYHRLANTIKQG